MENKTTETIDIKAINEKGNRRAKAHGRATFNWTFG
jgi:hypothetical protein